MKFTILQPMEIREGQKIVGRYGNKSVIAQIVPWQLMPRTTDGRPLDMLANAFAVPNRIIAFATYESSMTFQMERMWEHVIKLDKEGTSHDEIMNLAIEFVMTYNPQQGQELSRIYNMDPDRTYPNSSPSCATSG